MLLRSLRLWFEALNKAMWTEKVGQFVKLFMTNGQYPTVSLFVVSIQAHLPCCHSPIQQFADSHFSCWGTSPGASARFDLIGHIHKWVIEGIAPDKIIGTKFASSGYGNPTLNITRPAFP